MLAIEKALSTKLLDAREALVNKCIDILAIYRSDVVGSSGGANILLPEALKLFPLFILALVKNVIFRAGTDIKPDERTFYMMLARMLPASQLLRFIYPRLFALHLLPPEVRTPLINLTNYKRLGQKVKMVQLSYLLLSIYRVKSWIEKEYSYWMMDKFCIYGWAEKLLPTS